MPHNYRNKHGLNKYIQAYNIIERYARAKLVITTRLHCALPCVALETPVILLNLKSIGGASRERPSPRVSGLLDLFHRIDFYKILMQHAHVFLQNFNYSEPPPNPNREIANSLKETAWSFLKKISEMRDTHNMFSLRPLNEKDHQ